MIPRKGDALGAHRVIGEIARGGMGAVLRARAPDGRDVAIKVLLAPRSVEAFARFERERRLHASLGEIAGFVPVLETGVAPAGAFIVMPLVTGGTLRARLERGRLSIDETLRLARSLAEALGRAHSLGAVHRDLKPENVLFDERGRPPVPDLGLAKPFPRHHPRRSPTVSL